MVIELPEPDGDLTVEKDPVSTASQRPTRVKGTAGTAKGKAKAKTRGDVKKCTLKKTSKAPNKDGHRAATLPPDLVTDRTVENGNKSNKCDKSGSELSTIFKNIAGDHESPTWLTDHMEECAPTTKRLGQPDVFLEAFSVPRCVPCVQKLGLQAIRSMDLQNGWDLTKEEVIKTAFLELHKRQPAVVLVCPPCTYFSKLLDSNYTRMDKNKLIDNCTVAVKQLNVALWMMNYQLQHNRGFIFEHPVGARSWARPEMVSFMQKDPSIKSATFDFCQFGLISKETKMPMQKRTTLLTNIKTVFDTFNGVLCTGCHEHQRIQGSEGGVLRSEWAQRYPTMFCQHIAECVKEYVRK